MTVNLTKIPAPTGDASSKAAEAFAALAKTTDLSAMIKMAEPTIMAASDSKKEYTMLFKESPAIPVESAIDLGIGESKTMAGMMFTNLGDSQVQIQKPDGSVETVVGQMSVGYQEVVQQMTQAEALVEELVNTHSKLKEMGAFELINRLDELKKLVQSSAQPAPDDQELVLKAPSGTVVFSAVSKKTVVSDKQKAIQLLGTEKWLELSTVSITDLKTYLSPLELTNCTKVGNGSRSLKSVVPN